MSTILVVDDMTIIRQPIEAALRREGYEVISAAHGQEALARLSQQSVNLILLDLAMPVMNGLEFLRQMRLVPEFQNIPVLVLTAMADREHIVEAARWKIAGYLLKSSFSLQEMLTKVQQILDKPNLATPSRTNPSTTSTPTPPPPSSTATPSVSNNTSTSSPPQPTAFSCLSASPPPVDPVSPPTSVLPIPSLTDMLKLNPPKDLPEALRSLPSLISRAEVTDRLVQCDQLRAFSPAVTQLLRLTNNPRCAMDDVVRAISQDHAIALKILKLANSVVYTRGEPVDSIQKAVLRIGLDRIRQAVLNIGVIEKFNSDVVNQFLDVGQFWEHSIGTGIIATELAHALDQTGEHDSAFTMGLLHDVGRIIFIEHLTDHYSRVFTTAHQVELPLEQVETRMLNLNHADLMDGMLQAWKFSPSLTGPIMHHHLSADSIRQSALGQLTEVAILSLANRLAHAFLLGTSGNETVYPTHELVRLLAIDPKVIRHIDQTARQQTLDIKLAMLTAARQARGWTQLRQTYLQIMPQTFNPLFFSAYPCINAYEYFVNELRRAEEGSSPNIGIVHLANVRERSMLSNLLLETEMRLGCAKLPLLIISPLGKLTLEDSIVARRQVELLPSPLPISRFLRAVNRILNPPLHATVGNAVISNRE